MRILYLTAAVPDYLADDLLYGLRSQLGVGVVDFPRKDVLYRSSKLHQRAAELYGQGFHCFGLDDLDVDRSDLAGKIRDGYFDAIVNSSAWRITCPLHPQLVVVDGEDGPSLTSRYLGNVALYFKRELQEPRSDVEPILFSLPDFLYDPAELPRTQQVHASYRVSTSGVRGELASRYPPHIGFPTWRDYQNDIKRSWFGISPRGAGYDCQRHYEILGRAVLCIYLDDQAPYLLRRSFIDGENCLSFRSALELQAKIDACLDPTRLIERGRHDLEATHLASRRAAQFIERLAATKTPPRRLRLGEAWHWQIWLRWQARRQSEMALGK